MNRKSKDCKISEKGQGLIEYVLILLLVAIIAIVILTVLGNSLREVYEAIVKWLKDPTRPFRLPVRFLTDPAVSTTKKVIRWCLLIAGIASVLYLIQEIIIPLIFTIIQTMLQIISFLVTGLINLGTTLTNVAAMVEKKIGSVIVPTLVKMSKSAWFWSNITFGNLALAIRRADVALEIFRRVEQLQITGPEAQLALFSGISLASLRAGDISTSNLKCATTNLVQAQETITQIPDEATKSKFENKFSEIGEEIGQTLHKMRKQQAWGIATVEDCEQDNTLYRNEMYTLSAGIGWGDILTYSGALATEPITLPPSVSVGSLEFEIAVWAEDMDIEPNWIETLKIDQSLDPPCLVQFSVVPRLRGKKTIRVDFYYNRYWVQQIELEFNIVKSPSAPLKVGMMLGISGLGDKSFNDSAYDGLAFAQRLYNIEFEVADSGTLQENVDCLQHWCETDCDLVIALGHRNGPAVAQVAKVFPDHHFAIIDAEANGNNVWSAVFREYEGDYIVGALAALVILIALWFYGMANDN